jgi:hypothetical protein
MTALIFAARHFPLRRTTLLTTNLVSRRRFVARALSSAALAASPIGSIAKAQTQKIKGNEMTSVARVPVRGHTAMGGKFRAQVDEGFALRFRQVGAQVGFVRLPQTTWRRCTAGSCSTTSAVWPPCSVLS